MSKYLYKKLRQTEDGSVDVLGYKEVTSGVLEGQVIKHFLDAYSSEAEAIKAHPEAANNYFSKFLDCGPSLSHLPGENDPVSGGVYPDDIQDAPARQKP